jgi:protein TonB
MEKARRREMIDCIAFRRLAPVTASLLIHLGIVGAIVVGPGWAPVHGPVLIAELVDPETAPVVTPPTPEPVVRDRRPITPPKPIATPLPSEPPAPALPEPTPPGPVVAEPPAPAAPEPPKPVAPAPAASTTPEPEAATPAPSRPTPPSTPAVAAGPPAAEPPVTAAADPAPGAFAAPPSTSAGAPAAPGPAVAAIPPDGVTQRALPRGGYQYRPAYPRTARSLGIQGTTLLHVLVSDRGRVAEVIVKQSAGHPDLDKAAADAVRRWRFEPARRGPDPVEMWVQLPFEFRLR